MFTGVGKLKISLPECGLEWKRKSVIRCVGVSVGESWCSSVRCTCIFFQSALRLQHAGTKYACAVGTRYMCAWPVCVLFADNWPLMVHLLLSWRALAAAVTSKHFTLTAHYPLWQINRIGKTLCWSHIENLTAKATAGEDAEFVMD